MADEALLHWDELDAELLEVLAADPARAEKLSLLRNADDFLRAQGPGRASACPPAEELFDFGRGPGAREISAERRAEIDRHVASCRACEGFAASLASAPPAPLILGGELLEPPVEAPIVPLAPRRSPRRWAWAAAAAVFVTALGLLPALLPRAPSWPKAPVLRGDATGALLFPRDRVLARDEELGRAWPALASTPLFEIQAQPEATEYRVEVRAHSGGAFERGDIVASWTGAQAALICASPLAPGHYTWRAWATVRGLALELGARDFEVVRATDVARELDSIAREPESRRMLAAIVRLDSLGFLTDARALARSLPSSPERDAYLDRAPGR